MEQLDPIEEDDDFLIAENQLEREILAISVADNTMETDQRLTVGEEMEEGEIESSNT
ncbi:MAG: hypothetical protein GY861_15145 [bacterium]|nr:hypothetical protein [bacterium]